MFQYARTSIFFLKTLAGDFRSVIYAYVVLKLIRIKTDFCISVLFLFCFFRYVKRNRGAQIVSGEIKTTQRTYTKNINNKYLKLIPQNVCC